MVIIGVLFAIFGLFGLVEGCAEASNVRAPYTITIIEGYNINHWADSIRKAEGNPNYGILAHYRHTSYRQACINTILHKYRDWAKLQGKSGKAGHFIDYLANAYAPMGVRNDPTNLNINWKKNVRYYL